MESFRHHESSPHAGFTLMELLIVMAIIAILAVLVLLVGWKRNIYRANDARRKSDLANIRRSFEEYYNDNDKYPPTDTLEVCGATTLSSYSLNKILCDPVTRKPYLYVPDNSLDLTAGNRICARLEDKNDPDIATIGCDPVAGCGWGEGWNYCLAAGATITAAGFSSVGGAATPTSVPTQGPPPKNACTPAGGCNSYDDPSLHGCPVSWVGACDMSACAIPANRCND